jgi:hypothetical protein
MRAVDTNVLVRLVTRDERRQVHAAEAFVEGCVGLASCACGTIRVRCAVFDLDASALATGIEMLLTRRP